MAALMYGFWLVLNGKITVEILLLGLPVMGLAFLFMCKFCDWSLKKELGLYRCVPLIIAYCGILIWEIIKSNLTLAKIVYTGTPKPVVRTVETGLKSRMARLMLANSITITPGTITMTMRDKELTIHCLSHEIAESLDEIVFEKWLQKIEEALHG